MFKILGLMILGIIIGYGLRRISFLRKVEVSISYTVFLLLFVLGVTIGSNRLIVDNLFSFGCFSDILFQFSRCISKIHLEILRSEDSESTLCIVHFYRVLLFTDIRRYGKNGIFKRMNPVVLQYSCIYGERLALPYFY